ncbi:ORF2 [Seal anellovirus 6]|uniref:ORF2 n=1 Tax=Seal anellovirus 6 TaxID=1566012 RepID=A0A0A7U2J0_9VIRU|nr:ORF2 [Seal anellovirus 6]
MSADNHTTGSPDLCHPKLYKLQEANWKRQVSALHKEFCHCSNFLDHFKWPTGTGGHSGGTGEGTQDGRAGGSTADIPGDLSTIGAAGGGDPTDEELLQ